MYEGLHVVCYFCSNLTELEFSRQILVSPPPAPPTPRQNKNVTKSHPGGGELFRTVERTGMTKLAESLFATLRMLTKKRGHKNSRK
jgi:hypothetical protein